MANQNLTQRRGNGKGSPPDGGAALRCALYARVSTEEQAKEGMSIEAQIAALRGWAKLKGWQIAGEYIDPGYTGGDDKRPELQRLLLDARRGLFQVVAVVKIDRFMRSLRLLKNYLHELEGRGISFVATQEGVDTSEGGTGRLLLNVLGSFAEFERERIGERVRDTRAELVEAGRWPAGRTLYGYRWQKEGRCFQVVEAEAEIVRIVFELYTKGNLSMKNIAAELNKRHYRMRGGGSFHLRTVEHILKHPGYKGQAGPYTYPPIVDSSTWEAAQRKRQEARQVRRNPRGWLLQGLVVCGLCGHKLGCRQKDCKARRLYECRGRLPEAHLDGSARCTLRTIEAAPLEWVVWKRFKDTASDEQSLRQSVERALAELEQRWQHLNNGASVEAGLKGVMEQKERAWNAHIDGHMPKEKMVAAIQKLEARERELRARLERLDPAARLEVAHLEEFITEARRIMAAGSIAIRDDGLWLSTSREGIQEGFHLGGSGLQPFRQPIKLRLYTVEGVEPPFDLRVTGHFWEGPDGQLRSMRRLLELFDIKVLVFPDHIEIRGRIPTQAIERKREQVSHSACRSALHP